MLAKEEVIKRFDIDPETVGNRFHAWWIIEKLEFEEHRANAQIGDLCIVARDSANLPIALGASGAGNCIGTIEDEFDRTYRFYYYRAIPCNEDHQ